MMSLKRIFDDYILMMGTKDKFQIFCDKCYMVIPTYDVQKLYEGKTIKCQGCGREIEPKMLIKKEKKKLKKEKVLCKI